MAAEAGPAVEPDEQSASLLAISRKMNSERDLGALLDLIAREATHLLDCERASIFLLDPETNQLWSKVALGSEETIRIDATHGIIGTAVTTGQAVNVPDAYGDPRFYPEIDRQTGYRTRSILAIAVTNQNQVVVGAFEALNKRTGPFDARDENRLKALASHAAAAIETAQIIGKLRKRQDDLVEQNAQLWRALEKRYSSYGIIGSGAAIQNVTRLIERIRDSQINVLITGESGTGKELAARAIHYSSARARKPFVALNCAALPEPLVESELFGIEKGVATGVQPRIGQFQKADGGTLFLDEIGDLSLTAQAKILRVLETRVVERVGGRTPAPVDVRLLAATNKNLEEGIVRGTFREDLYYRLKVVHIHMPPLREMREDIPALASFFLREYCREAGMPALECSPEVIARLCAAPWPGNARQLRNEVIRAAACARGPIVTEDDFADGLQPNDGPPALPEGHARPLSLVAAVAQLEKKMIAEALASCRNNQQQAARLLGVSRQGLINKIKRYGIR